MLPPHLVTSETLNCHLRREMFSVEERPRCCWVFRTVLQANNYPGLGGKTPFSGGVLIQRRGKETRGKEGKGRGEQRRREDGRKDAEGYAFCISDGLLHYQLCVIHRVQETAMAAVRGTIVSIRNTGLRMQVAAVHRTCSPP